VAIKFERERWDKIKEDSRRWWAGELERPLIQVRLHGADPGRPEPKLPPKGFAAFYGTETPAAEIVDRWDYDLSACEYLGDGFPNIWPNFGPGVMAAFMGANLECTADTCWFNPVRDSGISELRFEYNPDNEWYRHVRNLSKAADERWQGTVQVSMTDLGGNLDILSTFRPSEKLLLDLYDNPEAVEKRTWEAHELWWRYFNELAQDTPSNPGYTAWAPIFSETTYYMLQCDFCYMISPEMFDEFVKPELAATCRKLDNPFYHLDGVGQLPHLDSLLSIPELKGVQWIPGAGKGSEAEWPEVYRKIHDAGKLIQLFGGIEALDAVAEQIGTAKGIVTLAWGNVSEREKYEAALKRYGAI